jgi:Fibronectin type III domain
VSRRRDTLRLSHFFLGAPLRTLFLVVGVLATCSMASCGGGGGAEGDGAQPVAAPAPVPNPVPAPVPTPNPTPTGSATITWSVPTLNEDGTPLAGVTGYQIRYGTSPTTLSTSVDVAGGSATRTTVGPLAVGTTYYFSVFTVINGGISDGSSVASVSVL